MIKYLKLFSLTILTLFVTSSVSLSLYGVVKLSQIQKGISSISIENITSPSSTKIYSFDGILLTELGTEQRTNITFDEISPVMIEAVISIEDAKFFSHSGLDLRRMSDAMVNNFNDKSFSQGASTITQQLVKNLYFTSDKTIERKLKEALVAIEIEKKYTKEEIITAYLNNILFGGRNYGIEKASNYYFSKPSSELTLVESAILAGMIQSPNGNNPITSPTTANTRKNTVLKAMLKFGYISNFEYNLTSQIDVKSVLNTTENTNENTIDDYAFIDYVIKELDEEYQINPFTAGLTIYTTMDYNAQSYINDLMDGKVLEYPDEKLQAGAIFMENDTGKIRAIGGGRNINTSLPFNYATDALRQPGSTIKPILDYAPAFEYLNYSTGQPILDEPMTYSITDSQEEPMQIKNWDNQYKGWVTLRDAIIDSRNIPAVKTFNKVGSKKASEFAEKLGLQSEKNLYEAHALGGYTYGYTVLQMANAYSSFANGGNYIKATSIEHIYDDFGNDLANNNKQTNVMKPSTAFMINDILHENTLVGASAIAGVDGMYLAGKTGQSNYDAVTCEKYGFPPSATKDSWYIGYSKKYTTAIWTGYQSVSEGAYLDNDMTKLSWKMFHETMKELNISDTNTSFSVPNDVISVEVERYSNELALPSKYTPELFIGKEYFIKGTEPTKTSNYWNTLPYPKYVNLEYSTEQNNLAVSFLPYNHRYSEDELDALKKVTEINNYYNAVISDITKQYDNHTNTRATHHFIPDQLFNTSWQSKISKIENNLTFNTYATDLDVYLHYNHYDFSNITIESKLTNPQTLLGMSIEDYITLFKTLKNNEINSQLSNSNLTFDNILTQNQIDALTNGYNYILPFSETSNTPPPSFGKYKVEVYGFKYGIPYLLTTTTNNFTSIRLSSSQFYEFDSFGLSVDFENYPDKLTSDLTIIPTQEVTLKQ